MIYALAAQPSATPSSWSRGGCSGADPWTTRSGAATRGQTSWRSTASSRRFYGCTTWPAGDQRAGRQFAWARKSGRYFGSNPGAPGRRRFQRNHHLCIFRIYSSGKASLLFPSALEHPRPQPPQNTQIFHHHSHSREASLAALNLVLASVHSSHCE